MLKGIVKRLAVSGVVAGLILSFAACGQLDVIGNGSVTSFDAVLNLIPDQVETDEINAGWSLTAPDGSARFVWSGDWSQSQLYAVMLELDAAPFIEAGLDPEKLPDDYAYYDDMLTVGVKLGDNRKQNLLPDRYCIGRNHSKGLHRGAERKNVKAHGDPIADRKNRSERNNTFNA